MQSPSQLRILIADDHELVRRGVKALLSSHPGWVVCAEAASGREAIIQAEKHRPDIAVMDLSMPELNGLDAIRRICKMLPKIEIVVFSVHHSDQLVRDIVNAGASAYVSKSDCGEKLLLAVEALVNHRPFFTSPAPGILTGILGESESPQQLRQEIPTLREREVIQLIAEGNCTKEVAYVLGISTKTAQTHRANLMRKLKLHTCADIVRYAVRNTIIEP